MRIKFVIFFILSFFLSFSLIADEKKENTDIKFYTGVFDWADEKGHSLVCVNRICLHIEIFDIVRPSR